MNQTLKPCLCLMLLSLLPANGLATNQATGATDGFEPNKDHRPIVIAHRGASGYIVEHSEGGKVLAHAQGADYIEQDVVLTKDLQFVVTHDITMEETTDVHRPKGTATSLVKLARGNLPCLGR